MRRSVARLQSAGAGSGLETKRSAIGAHLFADTDSQTTAAVSQSHCEIKISRQVDCTYSSRRISPPDQRQSARVQTVGSYAQ